VPFVLSMSEEWPFLRARVCIEAVKVRGFLVWTLGQPMIGLEVLRPRLQSDGMSYFS
jgi:hypothetical protein